MSFRAPVAVESIMIIAAVFPLLTGVVVRSFAFLILLGKNGIMNNFLVWTGLSAEPLTMLYAGIRHRGDGLSVRCR